MELILSSTREEALELDPASRSHRLREMYWNGTHRVALQETRIVGSGEDTLIGHARDFAALLDASEPFIQDEELIVGGFLAAPKRGWYLEVGYYDPHVPPGHENILALGLAGMRDSARRRLASETDGVKREFLEAVSISYDAACSYVQKVARCAAEMAEREVDLRRRSELEKIAAVCDELASSRPSSFHAALQLVEFTRVFGGHGCTGRFDQWMLPFYEHDIAEGTMTRQDALGLLECFFIKVNQGACTRPGAPLREALSETALPVNDTLRNITLGGQTRAGEDACNELTFLCLEAGARLMLPEPKLNVRFFSGSPRRLLRACCRVLAKGMNNLAIYNDSVALPALDRLGIPLEDARDYCNDGCSELVIGGKTFFRFLVHDSLVALGETVLEAGEQGYADFEDCLADFKSRISQFTAEKPQSDGAITFPYFAASIDDCLQEASPTGARYTVWGSILGEVGNAADGLAAIKKFIYEDRVLSWHELAAALRADYEGYEPLRQMLRNRAPKYGNDVDFVDEIAKEIAETYCDAVQMRAGNTRGPGTKHAAGFMLFGIDRKSALPASPDGRRCGDLVANSFSPSVGVDKSGPTAVLRSASKTDLTKASNGSVLDIALDASVVRGEDGIEKLAALVDGFLRYPSVATLQINIIDREALLKARENPNVPQYRTLLVRVWGFSAVFVELSPALQDHVLARTEHQLG